MARTWRQTLIYGCTVIARTVLGAMVVGLALLALLLYTVDFPHPSSDAECHSHLKSIALALLNYEAAQGAFPPAFIADKNGVPMHSWRVLLLPYLEQPDLYARYDLSQPWNSPKNSELASQMPFLFRCPHSRNAKTGYTNYRVSVGPGHIFDGTKSTRLNEIKDGLSNTIMVMEVPDSEQISWLSPFDGTITNAKSSHPRAGTKAVFADGSIRFLESNTRPETLAALQTIAGGEHTQLDNPPLEESPHLNLPMSESLPVAPPIANPAEAKH